MFYAGSILGPILQCGKLVQKGQFLYITPWVGCKSKITVTLKLQGVVNYFTTILPTQII